MQKIGEKSDLKFKTAVEVTGLGLQQNAQKNISIYQVHLVYKQKSHPISL